MAEGWIKLHRALLDHPVWSCATSQQKAILITILMEVNHQPNSWEWKGEKFNVVAGQMITSLPSLCLKSGKDVTVQKLRTALKRFVNLGFLTDESTAQGRLITVINWGIYQAKKEPVNSEDNRQLTDEQQTANRQLTSNKEGKNVKTEKNNKEKLNAWFEEFYNHYGKKEGRKPALTKFLSLNPSEELFKKMMDSITEQKQSRKWLAGYAKNPATWLNQEGWNDELKYDSPAQPNKPSTIAQLKV